MLADIGLEPNKGASIWSNAEVLLVAADITEIMYEMVDSPEEKPLDDSAESLAQPLGLCQ